jgi:hypothetical protein
LVSPQIFEHIYLNYWSLNKDNLEQPISTRVTKNLVDKINLNLRYGIKMVFLDRTFGHHTSKQKKMVMEQLCEMSLEQLIIMETTFPLAIEERANVIHHVIYDIDSGVYKFA